MHTQERKRRERSKNKKGENMRRKGLTAAETVVHIYSNYSLKTAGCMNNLTWHPFSPTPLYLS